MKDTKCIRPFAILCTPSPASDLVTRRDLAYQGATVRACTVSVAHYTEPVQCLLHITQSLYDICCTLNSLYDACRTLGSEG